MPYKFNPITGGLDYYEVGTPGPAGEDGYTPIKGVDYFDGAKGDPGNPGLDGNDGYTPIKGIDYFDGAKGDKGDKGDTGDPAISNYIINIQALTSNPTDAQTVYFGMLPKAPTTTANTSKVYIRKAGTIKVAEIYCYSGTAAGTNENWSLYIRKNNTTDYLIATLGVATSERVFSNTGLSITMAVGDYFEIKGIQPTWATNPTATIYGGYIYLE